MIYGGGCMGAWMDARAQGGVRTVVVLCMDHHVGADATLFVDHVFAHVSLVRLYRASFAILLE